MPQTVGVATFEKSGAELGPVDRWELFQECAKIS